MNTYNWTATLLFAGVYLALFAMTDNAALMINAIGFIIVVSGTLGALFLSYPFDDIEAAVKVAKNTYSGRLLTPEKIITVLRELAVQTRSKGVLALEDYSEQTTIGFLKRALNLLVDGFSDEQIQRVLGTEMFYFKKRRRQTERVFRHAARLAPAFGVAGSVIGLIAMLGGLDRPDVIIQSIPIALTSTLYGIVLSNFILTPIAESIHAKTERELLLQKLVTDGVITIRREPNPTRLATLLESCLPPAARQHEIRSAEEYRDRIREIHQQTS